MHKNDLYQDEGIKSAAICIRNFEKGLQRHGFLINNPDRSDIAKSCIEHEVTVGDDFDQHMTQVTTPVETAQSLRLKPDGLFWCQNS